MARTNTPPQSESYKTIRDFMVTFRRGHSMVMGQHTYHWNAYINFGQKCIAWNCVTKAKCEKEARAYLRQMVNKQQ